MLAHVNRPHVNEDVFYLFDVADADASYLPWSPWVCKPGFLDLPKRLFSIRRLCLLRSLICGDVNFFNQKPELRSSCILFRYLDQISPEILKVTIARNESTLEDKTQASTLQDIFMNTGISFAINQVPGISSGLSRNISGQSCNSNAMELRQADTLHGRNAVVDTCFLLGMGIVTFNSSLAPFFEDRPG